MANEKEQEQQEDQQQQPQQQQQQQQQQPEQQSNTNQVQESPQNQPQAPASPQQTPQQQQSQRPRPSVHKTDYEKDVVYLYQFGRTATGPIPSPFCVKVETWIRIMGIKYENVDHRLKFKSKKGQLPFVEINGTEIADSTIIIRELSKQFGEDLDASLTNEQRHLSHALCIMLDHHTGWVYRWWIYNHPNEYMKSFKINAQQLINSKIPAPILNFFMKMKLKGKKKSALAHGLGVHSPEDIFEFGKADLLTLQELLGDKPFFFGDEPKVLDCVAFSHLLPVLGINSNSFPLKEFVETECPRLVSLVERIKERYWPDWDEMCKTLDLNTHLPKKKVEEEGTEKEKEKREQNGEKEKSDTGTPDDKESEPEKEKIEKDEKEKEKEKEIDEGDNKQKEGLEEKMEENKKE